MGMPTVTVEAALTTDPGATPTWTDLSSRIIRFSVNRGRQRELDTFSAGRAQIVLSNEDRALDPTYTSSAYYPNVLPMRRIRIRAVYSAVTYDIFNGYVDSWDQTYDPPSMATCTVQATDAFKVLAGIELPASVYEREVLVDTPTHWWRLGEPSGTVAFDRGSSPVSGTYSGGVSLGQAGAPTHDPDSAASFDGIDDYVTFGAAPRVTGFPYTIELWLKISDRSGVLGDYYFFSQNTNAGAATDNQPRGRVNGNDFGHPGRIDWDGVSSTSRIDDGAWHHVVLTATSNAAGAQTLYIDGVAQPTGTANTPGVNSTELLLATPDVSPFVSISRNKWPGSIDEFAIYNTALSAARVAAHNTAGRTPWDSDTSGTRTGRILDAAGWPASDRNIDAGQAILQSADLGDTALSNLQSIEQTEQGALFVSAAGLVRFIGRDSLLKSPYTTSQGTFGDSGSELEYGDLSYRYDDQTIVNEARVSRSGGTVQVVTDVTSQTKYLRRTRVVDGLLNQSDQTSLDLANWIVNHYKDPFMRATDLALEPSAGNDTTHFPQVLGRELMDRVTVRRRPQNLGSAIDQDAVIEGIAHDVTAVEWKTRWNLSPAETQVYWILGTAGFSELEQTTRLGF